MTALGPENHFLDPSDCVADVQNLRIGRGKAVRESRIHFNLRREHSELRLSTGTSHLGNPECGAQA